MEVQSIRTHADTHVSRCTRDPSCIMDVLSDAQWRTNTPGLPVLSGQGRTLGNKRRLYVKESGRGACNTHLLHSLPPPRPGFVVSHHRRRDARVQPRKACFQVHNIYFSTIVCGWEQRKQTSAEFTQLLKQRNGEPIQGWMQQEHARASSLLFRFGSRRPRVKILAHQAPPPPHLATCRQGEATIRRDLDGPPPTPLQFDAERLTVSRPDNKMQPYGAPKVKRRGESHAGAPRLKGQEPDIRASGRLAWIK